VQLGLTDICRANISRVAAVFPPETCLLLFLCAMPWPGVSSLLRNGKQSCVPGIMSVLAHKVRFMSFFSRNIFFGHEHKVKVNVAL
jgi:hypothetical protein